MKKKIFGLSTIVLMLLGLAACKAAVGVPTLGNKAKVLKPGEVLVRVSIADENFPSYRAIYPESWTEMKKAELSYWIYRESVDPNKKYAGPLEWSALKKDYYLELADGTHNYIMVGRKGGDEGDPIALISEKTTITIPGANLLDFVLRPYRITQDEATKAPKGGVNISVRFLNPEAIGYTPIDRIAVTLEVRGSVGTKVDKTLIDNTAITTVSGTSGINRLQEFKYTAGDITSSPYIVTPGVYNLKVELYKGESTTTDPTSLKPNNLFATIEDIVVVDPANISRKTIIQDEPLDVPPIAPANLAVTYKRPDNAATTSTYQADFTWQDKSYNEENFVLTIESSDHGAITPVTPTDLTKIPAGTETATVTLELGKKYTAKIKAVNKFGDSTETRFIDANTGDLIHLARIKYTLNSGVVIENPNDDAHTIKATSGNNAIGYYTQQIAAQPVLLPGMFHLPIVYRPANTSAAPYTNYILTGWKKDGIGSPMTTVPSTEYGELAFTADWAADISASATFPTYNDYCFIEGQNNWITVDGAPKLLEITAKVNPQAGYKIAEAKWYIDGIEETSGTSMDTAASPQTTTLKKDVTAGWGVHHVWVVIRLENKDASTGNLNGPDKWVSTYCYVRVK